mmetsp:Transcript_9083/g.13998  ORF Transcript_9083/g.13998 Transcript_9083/m.13998 type:complete len:81 (-) Transcript_9083:29-271(-)
MRSDETQALVASPRLTCCACQEKQQAAAEDYRAAAVAVSLAGNNCIFAAERGGRIMLEDLVCVVYFCMYSKNVSSIDLNK